MKNIQRHFSGFLLLLLLSAAAHSEDEITTDIIEISPGIGYYHFDDARNLDDAAMIAVGLGLHLSRRWAVLFHYSALDTTVTVNGDSQNIDMQKYHVDVHCYFNTEKYFRPYLVAGVGQMDLVSDVNESNKNMLNAGFGLSYKMTPLWSIRADARIFSSTNNDYHDNALTLTLGYRFNGGEKGD